MGPPASLSLRRKACCGFLSPLKSFAFAEFELVNLGSNGKHANLYTAEATWTEYSTTTVLQYFISTKIKIEYSLRGELDWKSI
jgi:hypothetical protein